MWYDAPLFWFYTLIRRLLNYSTINCIQQVVNFLAYLLLIYPVHILEIKTSLHLRMVILSLYIYTYCILTTKNKPKKGQIYKTKHAHYKTNTQRNQKYTHNNKHTKKTSAIVTSTSVLAVTRRNQIQLNSSHHSTVHTQHSAAYLFLL